MFKKQIKAIVRWSDKPQIITRGELYGGMIFCAICSAAFIDIWRMIP